jgi:phosphatidylglycerophosphate synthase
VVAVGRSLFWGLTGQLVVLLGLAVTVGLTGAGWLVGMGCGVAVNLLFARGLMHASMPSMGAANVVTLARATLVCAVAALVTSASNGADVVPAVVILATVALVLDAVDGQVARRTGSTSALGARFDGEVDAFLMLVMSIFVWPDYGWWVLAIGAMRYAFLVAGWALPWMRASLTWRYWRKVVAAVQGIVLVVVESGVLPHPLNAAALVVALALLVESFGRDVWWLWRHRERAGDVVMQKVAAR